MQNGMHQRVNVNAHKVVQINVKTWYGRIFVKKNRSWLFNSLFWRKWLCIRILRQKLLRKRPISFQQQNLADLCYLWPELDELVINDMWFQQDGANSHTARVNIDLLKGKFSERVISRNGPVEWSPRSCDLTPLDFFLWGHIKSQVYASKPATWNNLKDNIQREIANVPVEMCARVVENWVQRIDRCKRTYRMSFIKYNACATPTINLNSISQIFLFYS